MTLASDRNETAFSAETGCGSFTSTTRLSPEAGGGVEGVGAFDEDDGGVVDEGGTEGCDVDGDVSDEGDAVAVDGLDDEGSAAAVGTPTLTTTHIEANEITERLTADIFNTPPTLNDLEQHRNPFSHMQICLGAKSFHTYKNIPPQDFWGSHAQNRKSRQSNRAPGQFHETADQRPKHRFTQLHRYRLIERCRITMKNVSYALDLRTITPSSWHTPRRRARTLRRDAPEWRCGQGPA
ncbi:hypothetical protein RD149_15025 [Gordonia westfalica]|uniref:Uncharacterized protein n=1 Tax=Gordonia westfalica TaxID=158898 RepID=A0ABU2GUE0_9ACTN|nr:hypothetical protein [Gordonia westfalica]MDS1115076.1 hypothetical protein [Gordonia westfalica]